MRILAGDIGGTTVRLGVFELDRPASQDPEVTSFLSAGYSGLDEVVGQYLEQAGARCELACFALAGPVRGRRMRPTNLTWVVDSELLERRFGFRRVELMNDLEAIGGGLTALRSDELLELNPGAADASGNVAVIAAGTGLGEAGLYWDGARHHPFACEGGHASFAPASDEQWALARELGREHGHVSWERLVSGPGLVAIYRFQCRVLGRRPVLASSLDPAAAVAGTALSGGCEAAVRALELFVGLYGAEAGNLALKVMATGGVYLAGGIAPKIVAALGGGGFLKAFLDKGRMRWLLQAMPVRVVLSQRAALVGAAARAAAAWPPRDAPC